MYYAILIFLLCFASLNASLMSCKEEIIGSITWPTTVAGSYTKSRPLCTNEQNELIQRLCTKDAHFEDAPECAKVQNAPNPCPDDFQSIGDFCVQIIDATSFPPNCPYEEQLPFDSYVDLVEVSGFWMPVERVAKNFDLGLLYWTEAGEKYMEVYKTCTNLSVICESYQFDDSGILDKNCLVYYNQSYIKAVSCEESYPAVCAYQNLGTRSSSYCAKLYGSSCRQSDYSANSNCYCKKKLPVQNEKLKKAELFLPYQNLIFEATLQNCLIGLERSKGNIFEWTNSQLPLNYTNWHACANFDSDKKYGALYDNQWILLKSQIPEDSSLGCYLEEVEVAPEVNASLYLYYNEGMGYFTVTTSAALVLRQEIMCFTDAVPEKLISQLEVTRSGLQVVPNTSYSFAPSDEGPGSYWCEAFVYPIEKPISSNRVFLRDAKHFPGEYVATFSVSYINYTNPLTDAYVQFLHHFLMVPMAETIFVPRILGVLTMDAASLSLTFNAHLSSKSSTSYNTSEFLALKTYLESFPDYLDLREFYSADFCVEDITDFGEGAIVWPLTKIQSSTDPLNGFCVSKILQDFVRRTCGGGFIEGAIWSDVEPCTYYKPSNLTRRLKNILENSEAHDSALVALVGEFNQMDVIDVFVVSKIFEKMSLASEITNFKMVTTIFNALVEVPRGVLRKAQIELTSTDWILRHFVSLAKTIGEEVISETNVFVSLLPKVVIATMVQKEPGYKIEFLDYSFKENLTFEDVKNFDSSIVLGEELFAVNQNNQSLVLVIYLNDALFNSEERVNHTIFQIVSKDEDLEEIDGNLTTVYYAKDWSEEEDFYVNCAIWTADLGAQSNWQETSLPKILNKTLLQCDFQSLAPLTVTSSKNSFNITDSLIDLLESDESLDEKLSTLIRFGDMIAKFNSLQIYLVVQLFGEVVSEIGQDNVMSLVKTVVELLLSVPKSVMLEAQDLYNATDKMVIYLDDIIQLNSQSLQYFKLEKYRFEYIVCDLSNFVPLYLIIIEKTNNKYRLTCSADIYNFSNANFLAAIVFNDIKSPKKRGTKIMVTMYSNDNFFNEKDSSRNITQVFGVMAKDFELQLHNNISLFYKSDNLEQNGCAIWSGLQSKGYWEEISGSFDGEQKIVKCALPIGLHFAATLMESVGPTIGPTPNVTESLEDILNSSSNITEKLLALAIISSKYVSDLSPADIDLIAEIFEVAADSQASDLVIASGIMNDLMEVSKLTMKESQYQYSSTDRILHALDVISKNYNDELILVYQNFQIVATYFENKNISGVLLSNCSSSCNVSILYGEVDFSKLDGMEAVLIFSEALLAQLNARPQKLVVSMHSNNVFFNEPNSRIKKTSKIFGVLLPDFQETFQGPISFYFNTLDWRGESCAFWNFSEQYKGEWAKDGQNTHQPNLSQCDFDHVTHFGLLISNDQNIFNNIDKYYILDVITTVNCVLSLAGILGILLTGVLFETWRRNTGNQILLNFCLAISVKMLMLYISASIYDHEFLDTVCAFAGAVLHFSMLSEFCWMLVIAILQFRRFVEVLGGPPKYILIKGCVCGWIFPVIPVTAILILDYKNYLKSKSGLCYPTDLGLYLGIWLPIIIIVAINLVIFMYIMYNVCQKRSPCVNRDVNEKLFEWRLAFLLFFMLGITWIAGFLAQIDEGFNYIFIYIFTFTATLQGFIMFLFFILFNKDTRLLYIQGVRRWMYTKNLKYHKK